MEKTCADRIADQMKGREAYAAAIFAAQACSATPEQMEDLDIPTDVEDDELTEAATDRLMEWPLAVTTFTVLRIDLSTGGPGDWLEAKLNSDNLIESVTYHFNDWFDHAEMSVPESSPLWEVAANYAELAEVYK